VADVNQPGSDSHKKVNERIALLKLKFARLRTFWDIFGDGHPIRATVSEMGPLILSRLFDLNETQSGVLSLVFKIADDNDMDLLDLKDLQAMLQYVGNNAHTFQTQYGNVTGATIGAIQRSLLTIQQQGAEQFFGEPVLDLDDMMRTDARGRGMINILASDKLMTAPKTYTAFLLWLLAGCLSNSRSGRSETKLVFFFDEPTFSLLTCPRHCWRRSRSWLIRSKGVGVFFITQNPLDVPQTVLGQRKSYPARPRLPPLTEGRQAQPDVPNESETGRRRGHHAARHGRGPGFHARSKGNAWDRGARFHAPAPQPDRTDPTGNSATDHPQLSTRRPIRERAGQGIGL
jgi:hypothetical protein